MVSNLDKLAQYGKKTGIEKKSFENELKSKLSEIPDNLKKRQKNKAISKHIALKMINKNQKSPLKKSYWNTYYCSEKIEYDSQDHSIKTRYCKNRVCIVCNRIRMGQNIKEYVPLVSSWNEVGFVTLSTTNCIEGNIRAQVNEYMKVIELIKKQYNRQKIVELKSFGYNDYEIQKLIYQYPSEYKLQAIVKIEVTYNNIKNTFHPHLHLLVNGYNQSDFISNNFVEKMTKRGMTIDSKAQMVMKADVDTVIEMMKYFTKVLQRDKNGNLYLPEKKLDSILRELYKVPLVRCIGIDKKEREFYKSKFEKIANIKVDLGNKDRVFNWVNLIFNWVDQNGEMLLNTEIPIEYENYIKGVTETLKISKKEFTD